MRNSDKLLRLARRKASLENAVMKNLPQDHIEKRAEKVKQAVLTVLKKHRVRYTQYDEDAENSITNKWTTECEILEKKWLNMTVKEIIEISGQWPEYPKLKDIGVNFN